MENKNSNIVSFDDEMLILVDENDNEIGYEHKNKCHEDSGILHRAFSIFIFNDNLDLLMQKRSDTKLLWGDFWSNTVCSHPRKGESMEFATQRRLKDEMGISTDLKYLFKFQYQAKFKNIGSENELCSVYVGHYNGPFNPNPTEIKDMMFIPYDKILEEITRSPKFYTPWFVLEWEKIIKDYKQEIVNLI